jgi:SH3-like domain-containing protein
VETTFASVKGVAAGDVLNARIGPHAAAALVAALPPDTRCVRMLNATSEVSGQKWQAIALADGQRGWVNWRCLAADPSCPG